jgi:hypothetical protein
MNKASEKGIWHALFPVVALLRRRSFSTTFLALLSILTITVPVSALDALGITNNTKRSVTLTYKGPDGIDGEISLDPGDYYSLSVEKWMSITVYDAKTGRTLARKRVIERSPGAGLEINFEGGRYTIYRSGE